MGAVFTCEKTVTNLQEAIDARSPYRHVNVPGSTLEMAKMAERSVGAHTDMTVILFGKKQHRVTSESKVQADVHKLLSELQKTSQKASNKMKICPAFSCY